MVEFGGWGSGGPSHSGNKKPQRFNLGFNWGIARLEHAIQWVVIQGYCITKPVLDIAPVSISKPI
jgi:hypothetical protein